MTLSDEQANKITGGVWLIGLGVLFATNYWWPGILFVVGAGSIAQGLVEGRGWYALQGATWTFGLGVLFAVGFNLATLFILLGASMLLGALVRPSPFAKPKVDNSLE